MMRANLIAENTFATFGAVCWSIQLIPQIIINYRRHNATGLQPAMMLLWSCAGVPLGIYNISEKLNVALRVQPQILSVLSLITLGQCVYYEKKWSPKKCMTILVPLAIFLAGVEVGGVLGLRTPISRDVAWPTTLTASLSAGFLAAGVLRHYWDIYIFRTVRGISFIFVALDAAGDLFSLLSLLFAPNFNILCAVIYSTELTLWIGIFVLGFCFNLRAWLVANNSRNTNRGLPPDLGVELPTVERVTSSTSANHISSSVSVSSVFATARSSLPSIRRVGET